MKHNIYTTLCNRIKLLFVLFILCASGNITSQLACGSDIINELESSKDQIDHDVKSLSCNCPGSSSSESIIVNVVLHQFYDDMGIAALSLSEFQEVIDNLNAIFPDPFFFKLAEFDDEGNCHNGINSILVGGNYTMTDANEVDIKTISIWDTDNFLNIWSVRHIILDDRAVLGFSRRPDNTSISSLNDGVVVSAELLVSPKLLAHEIGHYFGLYHVWGDNENETTNCHLNTESCFYGDHVADTHRCRAPFESSFPVPCSEDYSILMCSGDDESLYPKTNIMSYTPCREEFTLGQKERMVCFYETYRTGLSHTSTFEVNFDTDISNDFRVFNDILVKSGATLNIESSVINFTSGQSKIKLERGSKLIVDNSTLTSCNEQWLGVFMEAGDIPINPYLPPSGNNAPVVLFQNSSSIENSVWGITNITLPGQGKGCSINQCDFNGILIASDSEFNNNIRATHFVSTQRTSTSFTNCVFNGNSVGIGIYGASGVTVEGCDFNNQTDSAIRIINATIDVAGGNTFNNNSYGINLKGTVPGTTGGIIGDMSAPKNTFTDNKVAIFSNGSTNSIPLHIINNKFSQTTISPIQSPRYFQINLVGENLYEVENNTFETIDGGNGSAYTGVGFNKIQCNLYSNVSTYCDVYLGQNDQSEFLGNNYYEIFPGSNPVSKVHLLDASVRSVVGLQRSPAGNCFDVTALSLQYDDISSINSSSFDYWYNMNISCEEPLTISNYNPRPTPSAWTGCGGIVGVFNLIDPDDDGEEGMNSRPTFNHQSICQSCILDSISYYKSLSESNAALYEINPSDPILQENYYIPLEKYNQWIEFGLYFSNIIQDSILAESILLPLLEFNWRVRLFGHYIKHNNYSSAQNLLNNFDLLNPIEKEFVDVESINLNFLQSTNPDSFSLTTTEYNLLYNIGSGETVNSGIARSLLYLLNGEEIPFYIPPIVQSSYTTSIEEINISDITVKPIPSSGIFRISSTEEIPIKWIKVYNNNGSLIKIVKTNIESIDLSTYHQGIYYFFIELTSGKTEIKRVVKI